MKAITFIAPLLAAASIGAATVLAPVAGAATHPAPGHSTNPPAVLNTGPDPLVPYGTDPQAPFRFGYINPNHDEGDFTNGQVDVPF